MGIAEKLYNIYDVKFLILKFKPSSHKIKQFFGDSLVKMALVSALRLSNLTLQNQSKIVVCKHFSALTHFSQFDQLRHKKVFAKKRNIWIWWFVQQAGWWSYSLVYTKNGVLLCCYRFVFSYWSKNVPTIQT